MQRMKSGSPARKVVSSALAAPLSVILIYVIETFLVIDIPQYVEAAIMTVLVFLTGYLTPPASIDSVQPANAQTHA